MLAHGFRSTSALALLTVASACLGRGGFQFGTSPEEFRKQSKRLAAGGDVSCFVETSGKIRCWGSDGGGEGGKLGNGPTQDTHGPVYVSGLDDAVAISSTGTTSCAVTRRGTAHCWGNNGGSGVLGAGTTTPSDVPVQVAGLSDAVAITVGGSYNNGFACAVRKNGAVRCWGSCERGTLGDGRDAVGCTELTPIDVFGLPRMVQLDASPHTRLICGVTTLGTVYCWGNGSALPNEVAGLEGVVSVSLGATHNLAVHEDGTVSCWGMDTVGECGLGQSGTISPPQRLPDVTDVAGAIASAAWSCLVFRDGELRCWGDSRDNTDLTRRLVAAPTPQLQSHLAEVRAVALGTGHGCALLGEAVHCWGANSGGQSGPDVLDFDIAPHRATLVPSATALRTNRYATCGLVDGRATCWGGNPYGSLGDGTGEPALDSVTTVAGIDDAVQMELGTEFACVRRATGIVACFGRNHTGQLGDGSTTHSALPVEVLGDVRHLALGTEHACAVKNDGRVWCWGNNRQSQLGRDGAVYATRPLEVLGVDAVTTLAAGATHTCALLANQTVRCWGAGNEGQLGDGGMASSIAPVDVQGLTAVTRLVAGGRHTCAQRDDGSWWCWGDGYAFRYLTNDHDDRGVPTQVALDAPIMEIGLGRGHTCVTRDDGLVQCWGLTDHGQCGVAAYWTQTPVTLTGIGAVAELSIGVDSDHHCARTEEGVICWGSNRYGQLGDGVDHYTPRRIGGAR